MFRILHLAEDKIFINNAHYIFEKAFPGANQFVIIKPPANPPLRFINPDVDPVFEIKSADSLERLKEMTEEYDIVVLHGIDTLKGELFLSSPDKHKFMGIIHGAEIYNPSITGDEIFGEKTKNLNSKILKRSFIEVLADVYRVFRYWETRHLNGESDKKNIFKDIKVYGFLDGTSYNSFKKNNIISPDSKRIPFSYYPIEKIITDPLLRSDGVDILLGNSAAASNNHLEAIEILKKWELGNRKVICPLSYGSDKYARIIQVHGKREFKDSFEPLNTFMPMNEYNLVLSRCGIVVMNHYRSQAIGNIIASLYMGAKVYLNDTDAYQFFKSIGCHIYLIKDDLVKNNERALNTLSREEAEHNRKIVTEEFSIDTLVKKLRDSFEEVFRLQQNSAVRN